MFFAGLLLHIFVCLSGSFCTETRHLLNMLDHQAERHPVTPDVFSIYLCAPAALPWVCRELRLPLRRLDLARRLNLCKSHRKKKADRERERGTQREMCIYIYIYAVKLLSGPSLGVLEVIIWSKFVFF